MTTDAAPAPARYVGGAGPDVVLLHGLGSRWQVFQPIIPELEKAHRVHAFDLPGFGAEPHEPSLRPGIAGLAEWVTDRLLADGGVRGDRRLRDSGAHVRRGIHSPPSGRA